jgi:hypothetical protein
MMNPSPESFRNRLHSFIHLQAFHEEWYREALVLWRGSVFLLWSHLRPAVSLLAMLTMSSLAGYFNLNGPLWYLKLDDAMGFLPFFAIGYVFPFDAACRATERIHIPKLVALGLFLLWVFLLIPLAGPLPDGHGNYNCCSAGAIFRSAKDLDYTLYWTRRLARVVLEMPPTLMLFFYLIPRWETHLSWIGQHIMYPYLFHQVASYWRNVLIQQVRPPKLMSTPSHVAVLLLHIPYAIIVLAFFASQPWRKLFSWCLEPQWLRPLFKEEQDAPEVPAKTIWQEDGPSAARDTSRRTLSSQALAQLEDSGGSGLPTKPAPEDDAASVESIPELQPSRSAGRFYKWTSTGFEIPWQCQARKYYVWLLPIFVGTLITAVFPFFLCVFYLPGWEVLLKVIEGFPLAFGIPIFFAALGSTVVNYAWHFFRLRCTDEVPEPPNATPLVHAVVVVAYKEPLDVLCRTMDSIVAQQGMWKQPIVVFASEERDDTAQSTFAELSKRVGTHFDMFLLTKHPLVEGETIGKSSNENFAVQELYKRLVEEESRDPFEILVTIVDADSIVSPTYLAHAEHSFRAQRDGRRLIYSGPLSVHRNFDDAGLLTQCYELNRCHADTFHDPFSQYQPQSNYSLTLGFAQELGFWTPDIMPEDIHTANKARVNNFGSRTTVAIPSLICNDLVVQFGDRYTQAMRHQMGSITEFAWALALFFESKTSFPGWWAVFNVEAGRDGSFLDIARSIVSYGCKVTVTYLIFAHWSMLHWKAKLYLSFVVSYLVWRWLWFWIAELFIWQTLLLQFQVKRPSVARWMLIVCTMPICLLVGELIFYLGATIHCLIRITFIGELAYISAPKGDAPSPAAAGTQASTTSRSSGSGSSSSSAARTADSNEQT